MPVFMLNSVLSIYAREYVGASVAEVGLIFAAWSLLSLIAKPLVGMYCHGPRLLTAPVAASIFFLISPLGMALAPTPLVLALFMLIHGLGSALNWGPTATLAALLTDDEGRDDMINRYTLSNSIGMTLGPGIAAVLEVRQTILSAAIVAGFSLILGFTLLRRREALKGRLIHDEGVEFNLREGLKNLSKASFQIAFLAHFATSFVFGILSAYGTLHAKDTFKVSREQVSVLLFGYNLIVILGRVVLLRLLRLVKKERILILGLINGIAMLAALILSEHYVLFLVSFSLVGLAHSFVYPIGSMIVAESASRMGLSLSNSIYILSWDIGNGLGPIVSAPFAQNIGLESAFIVALSGMLGVLLSISFKMRSGKTGISKSSGRNWKREKTR
jgi:MFS family permease